MNTELPFDINELIVALNNLPVQEATKPVFKLYYDENGNVITYTMDELHGEYIVITPEQFAEARSDVIVKNGEIVYTHKQTHIFKLEKSTGGTKCSKYDVSIIEESPDAIQWGQVIYEIR